MKITQRPYAGEVDQRQMAALVYEHAADHIHVVDLPYRFSSWAFDDPGNCRLWVDDDNRILAWGVMQSPFWTIDLACHPDAFQDVYPDLLTWGDQRAHELIETPYGHPMWFVNTFTDQPDHMRLLEAAGFASQADVGEDAWTQVLLQQGTPDVGSSQKVPEGFTIRPLAGLEEVNAYVDLHRTVFESKSMTADWRTRTLQHPDYVSDLDLVAVSPDGRLAAFCVCWLHQTEDARRGQVEPMGVHPDFQRLGLGRATLSEGLRQLAAYNVDEVFVETDNFRNAAFALYESVGFRVARDVLVYRKDYE